MSELPSSPEIVQSESQNIPVAEKPVGTTENRETPKVVEQPVPQENNEVAAPLPPVLIPDQQPTASINPPQYTAEMVHKGVHVNKYAKFATATFREFQRKLVLHYENLRNSVTH